MGDVQRSPVRFLTLLLTRQLSYLSMEGFSVRVSVFREVKAPMAVGANGDRIRHRIRSAVHQLSEMMTSRKGEPIRAREQAGWSHASQIAYARSSTQVWRKCCKRGVLAAGLETGMARWRCDRSPVMSVKDRSAAVRQRKAVRKMRWRRARMRARVENGRVGVGRIQAAVQLSN